MQVDDPLHGFANPFCVALLMSTYIARKFKHVVVEANLGQVDNCFLEYSKEVDLII
jgi:hypothetical protein